MDESSFQISAIIFTLANSYGSLSAVFSRILWMFFFMFRSNTVCLKNYWLIWVIAECHYVNLLIFLTIYNTVLRKNPPRENPSYSKNPVPNLTVTSYGGLFCVGIFCWHHITHLIKNLHNTDCEFYFIAKNFFSINFTFFSICFYYALNILTPLYRIRSWNVTRTYPVQCWHDMKVWLSREKTIHRCAIRVFTGKGFLE